MLHQRHIDILYRGCGADLLINIVLTVLGYIPGIIHALCTFCRPLVTESNSQLTSLRRHHLEVLVELPSPPVAPEMCVSSQ